MVIKQGRPSDIENRIKAEVQTYDFLDNLGVEYARVDHEKAETMEVCAQIDKALGTKICKNLFLCNRQCTQFYLLMTPGDKRFKTKNLSSQLGVARLSFADEKHMVELLGITPGSVSVMGLMYDKQNKVQLLIDNDLLGASDFGCHPCINTSSLKISTSDLLTKILPALSHNPIFVDLPNEE